MVWPAPPAQPRVRLAAIVSTAARPRARSWWRTALSWITGAPEHEAEDDALARPFDVALEPAGTLVVADPDARRVLRYDAAGAFLAELACARRPWSMPMSVAAAGDGSVLVADAGSAAIVRWSAKGCQIVRDRDLLRPTGLATDGDRIFVADPPAHQVVVLSAQGEIVARWGERGEADGQFLFPTDVALDSDGSLFVVDSLNFRIAHLAGDGRWLGAFGAPGPGGEGLERPKGVCVDAAAGLVYVTDAQRDVAVVFRRDGSVAWGMGAPGSAPGYLAHPAGIAVAGLRVAVADSLNRRVEIFEMAGGPP